MKPIRNKIKEILKLVKSEFDLEKLKTINLQLCSDDKRIWMTHETIMVYGTEIELSCDSNQIAQEILCEIKEKKTWHLK